MGTVHAQAGEFGAIFGIFFVVMMALVVAAIGLWIWMLVDAVQTPEGYFKSGTKTTWILVIALAGGIGAIIYAAAGRPDQATREWLKQARAAGYVPPPPGYPPPAGAYGPPQQGQYGPPAQYGGPAPYGEGYGQPPGSWSDPGAPSSGWPPSG